MAGLARPLGMLTTLFDHGWESDWGEAGSSIQEEWARSAFSVDTNDHALGEISAETAEAWAETCNVLCAQLNALQVKLAPSLVAKMPRRGLLTLKTLPPKPAAAPAVARPISLRMMSDAPQAMAA